MASEHRSKWWSRMEKGCPRTDMAPEVRKAINPEAELWSTLWFRPTSRLTDTHKFRLSTWLCSLIFQTPCRHVGSQLFAPQVKEKTKPKTKHRIFPQGNFKNYLRLLKAEYLDIISSRERPLRVGKGGLETSSVRSRFHNKTVSY